MRIIVVRHGEPDYAKDCLTELGHLHAKAAAERLANENIETIYTSPMGRARQTAQATMDRVGIKDNIVLDFMHEVKWGSNNEETLLYDGHPWNLVDQMAREGYDLTRIDWQKHPYFSQNTVTTQVEMIGRETDRWLSELGYVREGLYYRCMREEEKQSTVALFCHGGSSTALFARMFNLPFTYLCATIHMPFASITTVRFDSRPGSLSVPVMEIVSDSRHTQGM